jgi:hypothetical protein
MPAQLPRVYSGVPPSSGASTRPLSPDAGTGTVNGMLFAAILMLAGVTWDFFEGTVLSRWIATDSPSRLTYGGFGLQVALAVALLQGSEAARKFCMWVAGLGALVALTFTAFLARLPNSWIIGLSWSLAASGLFALLLGRRVPRVRAIVASVAVLSGWVGAALGVLLVFGKTDAELLDEIKTWTAADRTFSDEAAGVSLALPNGWVALKSGNPLIDAPKARLSLASTKVNALATLAYETTRSVTLDQYLDSVLESMRSNSPDMRQDRRAWTKIAGQTEARAMWTSWRQERTHLRGRTLVWRDGDRFFNLNARYTALQEPQAEPEIEALEKAIVFSSPMEAFLKERMAEISKACPLLPADVIQILAQKLPPNAPPEAFFRQGYQWALRGMRLADPTAGAELKEGMGALFAAVPASQRPRLGEYIERLTAGRSTTPQEDRAMHELVTAALLSLSEGTRRRIQDGIGSAIQAGRLM